MMLMSVVKSYAVGAGDMFYVAHIKDIKDTSNDTAT